MTNCCNQITAAPSRRAFLQTAILGAGVTLGLAPGVARAGHCEVLLLTCMDYRLQNETVAYMDGRGLRDEYDHVVLAGASLGVLTSQRPHWGPEFWEHVDAAIGLHHISKVIVLDHRDCGAYKLFLGEAAVSTPELETAAHETQLRALAAEIARRHAELEIELGIMALDGSVTPVSFTRPAAPAKPQGKPEHNVE